MEETTRAAKEAIEWYTKTEGIPEKELYVNMQLEFNHDQEAFNISYYVSGCEDTEVEFLNPSFIFDDREEAFKKYVDHLAEVFQEYPEAEKSAASTEMYEMSGFNNKPDIKTSLVPEDRAVMYDPEDKQEQFIDSDTALDLQEWS